MSPGFCFYCADELALYFASFFWFRSKGWLAHVRALAMYPRASKTSPGDKSHLYCTVSLHIQYAGILPCLYSQTSYPPKLNLSSRGDPPLKSHLPAYCQLTASLPPQLPQAHAVYWHAETSSEGVTCCVQQFLYQVAFKLELTWDLARLLICTSTSSQSSLAPLMSQCRF